MENVQTYKTLIGLFTQGHDKPCAIELRVRSYPFGNHSTASEFELFDKEGNSMGAVQLRQEDMKRLSLQLLMDLLTKD